MDKEKIIKNADDTPIVSLDKESLEDFMDEVYVKEEGVILEFDHETKTGKLRSLKDGSIYNIDVRELVRTKIELRSGDKVLFAPIEDLEGMDYARVVSIVELNA
ncbi:MAG: hypothetical protein HQL10_12875 [Nitrospirae bacterium]|nr:hypothetical protein [Nitrospirota bacterium]